MVHVLYSVLVLFVCTPPSLPSPPLPSVPSADGVSIFPGSLGGIPPPFLHLSIFERGGVGAFGLLIMPSRDRPIWIGGCRIAPCYLCVRGNEYKYYVSDYEVEDENGGKE